MKHNREALYAARPAPFKEGGVDEWQAKGGTVRFTEKGNYLYAIDLGNVWPSKFGFADYPDSKKPTAPYTLAGVKPVKGSEIVMLGSKKKLPWKIEDNNLVIMELPDPLPCDHAWSFKIQVAGKPESKKKVKYEPTQESLSKWECPQWFQDAVLGVYVHWSPGSVPGFAFKLPSERVDSGIWYGSGIYKCYTEQGYNSNPKDPLGVYEFHVKTYGDSEKFGYPYLIELFKAEKWDPDEWAELFKYAGCDYAGLAAEHGDGYPMYNSTYDSINSFTTGPKRDFTKELFAAVRKRGMMTRRMGQQSMNTPVRYSDMRGNSPPRTLMLGIRSIENSSKRTLRKNIPKKCMNLWKNIGRISCGLIIRFLAATRKDG